MQNFTDHNPQSHPFKELDSAASNVVRTLISIAERRQGLDATSCRLALMHSDSALLIHRSLRRTLSWHRLSDLQFAALVVLFSTEPEPLPASVLAEHVGCSRSAMTDALDRLEAFQFLARNRDEFDRRITYVRITAAGLETIDRAINDYLHAAEDSFRELQPGTQQALFTAYLELLRTLAAKEKPEAGPSNF